MAISPLLSNLIQNEYNTSHHHNKSTEKSFFCFECVGESLTNHGHRVIHAHKDSDRYTYRKKDLDRLALYSPELQELISVVWVCRFNGQEVLFLRSNQKERREKNIGKDRHYSDHCGKALQSQQTQTSFVQYCSLGCAVGLFGVSETPKKRKREHAHDQIRVNNSNKQKKNKQSLSVGSSSEGVVVDDDNVGNYKKVIIDLFQMLEAEEGGVHPYPKWAIKRSRSSGSSSSGQTRLNKLRLHK